MGFAGFLAGDREFGGEIGFTLTAMSFLDIGAD